MAQRRFTTLTDVARRAGVSVTTASKAINGRRKVSPETRARVLAAARELSFTPNPMARGLISGRSGTIGLIGFDRISTQRFMVPILLGAEAALSDIDLLMITTDTRGDSARLGSLIEMMQRRKVDGVLMVGDNNHLMSSVGERLGMPVAYVYGETGQPRDVAHVPNDRLAAETMAEHVASLGRHRIAYIGGPAGRRAVEERVAGTRSLLQRRELALAAPVQYGPWSQRWGRAAATQLLDQVPDLDAIICSSDQIASGVVDAVVATGRRIPGDVVVTGFDDWEVFAQECDPPLTTMDQNLETLGAAAVRDLFGIIDGAPVGGGVRQHDCTLVVRGSTVPAADPTAPPADGR